jgi:hypothetical protein
MPSSFFPSDPFHGNRFERVVNGFVNNFALLSFCDVAKREHEEKIGKSNREEDNIISEMSGNDLDREHKGNEKLLAILIT